MAVEVMVKAKDGRLEGCTASDMEALCDVQGDTFRAVLTKPRDRSLSQLGLWFHVCGMIADNYDGEPLTKDMVDSMLRIASGHVTVRQDKSGVFWRFPRSIAFNALSQDEFTKLVDRMLDEAPELFGKGLSAAARAELAKIATPAFATPQAA